MKNQIKKCIKKLRNGILQRKHYPHYLKKPLNEKAILLESQHGRAMDGNIFALLVELAKHSEYNAYTLYLTASKEKKAAYRSRLRTLGMERVKVVSRGTLRYFKVLATAKYLLNDTSFINNFIKREGQVYLNTWHGTPLKTLGKSVKGEAHTAGNVQKNLLAADYLLLSLIHI